jgi:hypothetical protein
MEMAVFWVVAPYSLVEVCRRFRVLIALMMAASTSETSVQLHGATTRKTAIFLLFIFKRHEAKIH